MSAAMALLEQLRLAGHPLHEPPCGTPWNQAEIDDLVGPQEGLREAAVLVPVVRRDGETRLILTRRNDSLRHHAGQISFPGGRIEADESPLHAALREAEEEIGLPPDATEALGYLDPLATITGFRVVPVLGLVHGEPILRPDPGEVAETFEVPLDFVLDPANHARHSTFWKGAERNYIEILWGQRRIWGVTAGIIANLSRRLEGVLA